MENNVFEDWSRLIELERRNIRREKIDHVLNLGVKVWRRKHILSSRVKVYFFCLTRVKGFE
jgi:hypothetical protein